MQRFMLTVTSKGQFTLPVEARALMGVSTGDKLELFVARDGTVLLRPRNKPASTVFGRGAAYAAAVSEDRRAEAIGTAVATRGARQAPRRKAG